MKYLPRLGLRHVVFPLCTLALLLSGHVLAQQPKTKRPVQHSDYDAWRSLQGQRLSPDGKFIAYALTPQEGDGEVVIRHLPSGREARYPRGSRPWFPTTLPKSSLTKAAPSEPPSRLAFTADNRFLVFQITPTTAELDKLKKAGKVDETARNSLGIVDLASGQLLRVPRVKAFQLAEDAGRFVVYHRDTVADDTKATKKLALGQPVGGKKKGGKAKEVGTDLVLRDLNDHSERVFADVVEFTLSKDGRTLVFAPVKREGSATLYGVTPGNPAFPVPLLSGPGRATKLTWDEKQTQLAFLSDRGESGASGPRWRLYRWDRQAALAEAAAEAGQSRPLRASHVTELVSPTTPGLRPGMVLSESAPLSFSPDGRRLVLGVAPPPEKPSKASEKEDKVAVELWHWKGDFVPPMEKIRAPREAQRTFRAVYHLKEGKLIQLADSALADVTTVGNANWGLGHDDRPYRVLLGYDGIYADHFLVNFADGSRIPLRRKHEGPLLLSPGGKYALFHDGKDWNTIALPGGKIINLTGKFGVRFAQEDFDTAGLPPPYGMGGWTPEDRDVLLYDCYDIWQVALDGSGARNLTAGAGRAGKLQLRYVRLDPQAKTVDPGKPLLLRAENLHTRDTGFYRLRPGAPPEKLIMAARNFGPPLKAKNADVLALTVSSFYDFPDLHVATPDFKEILRISNANPQKAGLLWGKSELVHYKSADGKPLQGILIKPENFDARKRYPLIVYIYERLSQNLHNFVDPRPGTSINLSYYASNGYLVLLPDIAYQIGAPGQSALKCVLPAVQAVVERGYVNENAIGIQGHSWGGYQIAYMITQTDRFKAAAAGAPVANMTSAYGGIRWGSGLPRQFQYERTQSRIGGSLWQYPLRFIENSPLFLADRVKTPLLMLHNDADDAVPWQQGIEFFLALRRLGKEAYLFNYPGELHGLRKRPNQKDYTVRLQQFFDHHLRGAPKPAWMESGIPYRPRPALTPARAAEEG
ncbi:MAG TPA: prolyl oligopeptidase family serine peptidase [Gemmataceae bacterium]|nr:prolyl oligopeptidase family serine peptidase [Gemmataceae bacterium]